MLQDYRRQIRVKSCGPVLKDQSYKRWRSDLSIGTNISLLSISTASNADQNENNNDRNRNVTNKTSAHSRGRTPSIAIHQREEQSVKHIDFNPYLFNKTLHRIPSTTSTLVGVDVDPMVDDLFDETTSLESAECEDYDPRAIRPPPFAQHIEQLRRPRAVGKPSQHRSVRIPVRTTRSEQLKLARQKSAIQNMADQTSIIKLTPRQPSSNRSKQQLPIPSLTPVPRPRTTGDRSLTRTESARSCRIALHSTKPLHFSSLLIQQMQQEMQNNQTAFCSQPLTQRLLHEHAHEPLDQEYKISRIYHWLDQLIPTDSVEHNDSASIESTLGTSFYDKLDDEDSLLSDDTLLTGGPERTYAEARRMLPIFQSELRRKTQQYNLMLTRLELDLYAM